MSLAELAAANKLKRVGARPDLARYIWRTWRRRDFIWVMAWSRVQKSVEGNRLGVAWLVIGPMLDAVVYGLVFGTIAGASRGPDYAPRVIIGVMLFGYFGGCFKGGAKAIIGHQTLVQSLPFPRLTLVLADVVEELIGTLLTLAVTMLLLPLFGYFPTWEWLLVVPLLAVYSLFNVGVCCIVARLTVHIRDLTQIIPYVQRVLFFTSGVFFHIDNVTKGHHWLQVLFDCYPIYQVLEMGRGMLMAKSYNHHFWLFLSITSVVTFIVGLLFFYAAEEQYGRD
ncbi:MAG: ABC transporter permease [Propionibacteriaceae bacterium]|jgi:teichoic acid transport system permease protein|nr:ABC transporter permease [Propionibacteriaceae bacterium]